MFLSCRKKGEALYLILATNFHHFSKNIVCSVGVLIGHIRLCRWVNVPLFAPLRLGIFAWKVFRKISCCNMQKVQALCGFRSLSGAVSTFALNSPHSILTALGAVFGCLCACCRVPCSLSFSALVVRIPPVERLPPLRLHFCAERRPCRKHRTFSRHGGNCALNLCSRFAVSPHLKCHVAKM